MKTLLKTCGVAAFWLCVWQLLALWVGNGLLLPSPVAVVARLGQLALTASFWQITLTSIGRILLGVVSGVVLGVVLAVLTSLSPVLELLISPAMTAMQATPVASFAILVLIWVDRDFVPVLICAMMVLPVILGSVSTGIRMTDKQLLEMARVCRLPKVRILRRIYVPSVLPFFRTSSVSALSLGWKAGIAAEVLTVPKASIGRMLSEGKLYVMTEDMFAWTVTIVALSLLLQKFMLWLMNRRGNHA